MAPYINDLQEAPIWQYLGMRVTDAQNGRATVTLPITPNLRQIYGNVHGGILATLLDSAMAVAIASLTGPDTENVTAEMTVYYLAPVEEGCLTAQGEVLEEDRRRMLVAATIFHESGHKIAYGTAQFIIRPLRNPLQSR